jgi:sugar-specific transcriptional regulator TrmB
MSDEEAISSLERLGLSNYEARVFVALQKLSRGSAREVHEEAGVPRSQVYGTAESLEDRGLVEVQRSNPITYRPVGLEEARERLAERFERSRDRAFDHLESVRDQRAAESEEREDIWTITGSAAVSNRLASLVPEAEETLVVGVQSSDLLTDHLLDALVAQAEGGVHVVAMSADEEVRSRLRAAGLPAFEPPPEQADNDRAGRLLLADDDTVLVSVNGTEETAICSSGTNFASVLVQLIRGLSPGASKASSRSEEPCSPRGAATAQLPPLFRSSTRSLR